MSRREAGQMGDLEGQRLFFALWPEESLRGRLMQLARGELDSGPARLVDQENVHATLAFLGRVNADRRQCLERIASDIAAPPFMATLDTLGWWPRRQLLWAGASTVPEPLLALVDALNVGLRECGLQPERRLYRLHLTLARKVRKAMRVSTIDPLEWHVDRFVLVASHIERAGAKYVVLRTWPLRER
jgi:2'-5' RNA ligase